MTVPLTRLMVGNDITKPSNSVAYWEDLGICQVNDASFKCAHLASDNSIV